MMATAPFRTPRLIPEKAVFRPALALRLSPGLNGTDMGTLSYREQLLHPKWQRLRLERLDAAGWMCQRCMAEDQTLHVHHKAYVRGRMAWEYGPDELMVLCETCHDQVHEEIRLVAYVVSVMSFGDAEPLLRGYAGYDVTKDEAELAQGNPVRFAGHVASKIALLSPDGMLCVSRLAEEVFRQEAGIG